MFEFDLKIQISDFLCYCKDRKVLSEKTIKTYSIDLKQFVGFSQCTYSKDVICSYISFLRNTYKSKIATLKAFTHYLMIDDIIEINPFDKIDTSLREPALLPKIIPLDKIKGILAYAYSELSSASTQYKKKATSRDVAVLEHLFATGARVSEVCPLTPNDVNFIDYTIKFYGKGSKEHIIPIENTSV